MGGLYQQRVISAAGSTTACIGSLLRVAGSTAAAGFLCSLIHRQPHTLAASSSAGSRQRCLGNGQWETIQGNNSFLFHVVVQSGLQGVKAKVPFPQFLLLHGRDNPTPLRVLLWKYQRRQRTRRIIVFSPNANFLALWCSRSVLFATTPIAERLSK